MISICGLHPDHAGSVRVELERSREYEGGPTRTLCAWEDNNVLSLFTKRMRGANRVVEEAAKGRGQQTGRAGRMVGELEAPKIVSLAGTAEAS